MEIACLDFEGVLVPEIWINVAEGTGIESLRATTRDIPDYRALMQQRLRILEEHKVDLPFIQKVIADMGPMKGAQEFLAWLRKRFQVILLSDTFYEFAAPLLRQLGDPVMFCHHLEVAQDGSVTGYHLRQHDSKREAVKAFQGLNYRVIAVGDSYNDTTMLAKADVGILFCPPDNVAAEFPQFPAASNYDQLRKEFADASSRLGELPTNA